MRRFTGILAAIIIMASGCTDPAAGGRVPDTLVGPDPAIVARLDALEAKPADPEVMERLDAIEAQPALDYLDMQAMLADLESSSAVPAPDPDVIARLDALESRPVPPPTPTSAATPDSGTIEARLLAIETAPAATPDLGTIEARLLAIETAPAATPDLGKVEARLLAIETTLRTPTPTPTPAPLLGSSGPLPVTAASQQVSLDDGKVVKHAHATVYVVDPPQARVGVVVVSGVPVRPAGPVPQRGITDVFPDGYVAYQAVSVELRDGWNFITLETPSVGVWPVFPDAIPCASVRLMVKAKSSTEGGWVESADGCTGGVAVVETVVVAVAVAPTP